MTVEWFGWQEYRSMFNDLGSSGDSKTLEDKFFEAEVGHLPLVAYVTFIV